MVLYSDVYRLSKLHTSNTKYPADLVPLMMQRTEPSLTKLELELSHFASIPTSCKKQEREGMQLAHSLYLTTEASGAVSWCSIAILSEIRQFIIRLHPIGSDCVSYRTRNQYSMCVSRFVTKP